MNKKYALLFLLTCSAIYTAQSQINPSRAVAWMFGKNTTPKTSFVSKIGFTMITNNKLATAAVVLVAQDLKARFWNDSPEQSWIVRCIDCLHNLLNQKTGPAAIKQTLRLSDRLHEFREPLLQTTQDFLNPNYPFMSADTNNTKLKEFIRFTQGLLSIQTDGDGLATSDEIIAALRARVNSEKVPKKPVENENKIDVDAVLRETEKLQEEIGQKLGASSTTDILRTQKSTVTLTEEQLEEFEEFVLEEEEIEVGVRLTPSTITERLVGFRAFMQQQLLVTTSDGSIPSIFEIMDALKRQARPFKKLTAVIQRMRPYWKKTISPHKILQLAARLITSQSRELGNLDKAAYDLHNDWLESQDWLDAARDDLNYAHQQHKSLREMLDAQLFVTKDGTIKSLTPSEIEFRIKQLKSRCADLENEYVRILSLLGKALKKPDEKDDTALDMDEIINRVNNLKGTVKEALEKLNVAMDMRKAVEGFLATKYELDNHVWLAASTVSERLQEFRQLMQLKLAIKTDGELPSMYEIIEGSGQLVAAHTQLSAENAKQQERIAKFKPQLEALSEAVLAMNAASKVTQQAQQTTLDFLPELPVDKVDVSN